MASQDGYLHAKCNLGKPVYGQRVRLSIVVVILLPFLALSWQSAGAKLAIILLVYYIHDCTITLYRP